MTLRDAKIKRKRRAAYVAQPAPWADVKEVEKLGREQMLYNVAYDAVGDVSLCCLHPVTLAVAKRVLAIYKRDRGTQGNPRIVCVSN